MLKEQIPRIKEVLLSFSARYSEEEVANRWSESLEKKVSETAAKDLNSYFQRPEYKTMRFLRDVQANPYSEDAAKKSLRKIPQFTTADELVSRVKEIDSRVYVSDADRARIDELFRERAELSSAQGVTEEDENSTFEQQDLQPPAARNREDDLELIGLYLESFGLKMEGLSADLLGKLTPEALEGVLSSFQGIPDATVKAIFSNNPRLLDPDTGCNFPAFVSDLRSIIKSRHAEEGYDMFDPERSPSYFRDHETLRRLLKASAFLSRAEAAIKSSEKNNE